MAYYPSFNSQLIRCAVDPNTILTLKGASHTLYTKVNEAPITTRIYIPLVLTQIYVNIKQTKPPKVMKYLDSFLTEEIFQHTQLCVCLDTS